MKILLINPAPSFYTGTASASAPLGLLSIATYLNQNGHNAIIYDRTIKHISMKEMFSGFKPDIIGISLISFKPINDALKLAEYAKSLNIKVVFGGQMASLGSMPDLIFKTGFVDLISVGEGEYTWKELADAMENGSDIYSIKGLAYPEDGKVVYTPCREFIDLSVLPVIDWTLVDPEKYFQMTFGCKKMMYICSSKGCIGDCSFCINKPFHRCTYRRRPVSHVMDEIEYLIKHHNLDGVYYAAEMFCKNRSEVYELCEEKRRRGLNFAWGFQTRIGIFKEEDFQYMYDNGCRWAFFGIESGSQRILDDIGKKINLNLVKPTFDACKKSGITAIGSFIVANIGETFDDVKQTIDLALSLDSAMYSFSCLAPCPGSLTERIAQEEYNIPPAEHLTDYTHVKYIDRPEPNLSKIPSHDITVIREYFQWLSFTTPPKANNGTDKKVDIFFIKVIADTIRSAMSNGIIPFFFYMLSAAKKFITTFYYAVLCRKTIKKYGLHRP